MVAVPFLFYPVSKTIFLLSIWCFGGHRDLRTSRMALGEKRIHRR
jgi:hypothetical protein